MMALYILRQNIGAKSRAGIRVSRRNEPFVEVAPARFAFTLFVDEMELLGDIARAEQQHAFAWQSVPPGAPCLLVIALQVFWQIVMHHEADVWFVDAHSKCNCRSDHADIISQEGFLIFRTLGA